MTWVLYDTRDGRRVMEFATKRGASISRTAWKRKGVDTLEVMDSVEFEATYNKWTTTRNLLTGEEVRIREQDVGTCVDPATERYWTM